MLLPHLALRGALAGACALAVAPARLPAQPPPPRPFHLDQAAPSPPGPPHTLGSGDPPCQPLIAFDGLGSVRLRVCIPF